MFFAFGLLAGLFPKINVSKISFMNTIRVPSSSDQDQERQFIGPDLGPSSPVMKELTCVSCGFNEKTFPNHAQNVTQKQPDSA